MQSITGPVENLNELEYIDGVIYANIWLEDVIALIDPETGFVIGWIDLSGSAPISKAGSARRFYSGSMS